METKLNKRKMINLPIETIKLLDKFRSIHSNSKLSYNDIILYWSLADDRRLRFELCEPYINSGTSESSEDLIKKLMRGRENEQKTL